MPNHSAAQPADRNLLFGILALQMDFIGRDPLIAAMQAWAFDKARSLGQILHDQGQLSAERLELLNALVAEHIRAHRGDPHLSLQAVPSIGPIRQELSRIADADLQASLAAAGSARAADPDATAPHVAAGREDPTRRYQILRPHAKGGLGEVFVAEDLELHREVALKEIQECHASDTVSRGRFLLEAEVTGRLEHPGIVPVYGLGQYADGRPFYAMRLIHGDNLKEAIRRFHEAEKPGRDPGERRLALRQLLGRFIDVCNAVAFAHSRGVLHRDLKPGNIMLGKYGETLVVDWGLAKVVGRTDATRDVEESTFRPRSGSGEAMTQVGSAIGTPAYMSPEQAAGQLDKLGPASDIYSLGATLYALLTGQAPFRKGDAGDVLRRVRTGDFLPPRRINADIPAPLEAICLKAMALDPRIRYASCAGLAEDVEHWLADEPVRAYPEPWTTRLRRWLDRHRIAVSGMAAALHGLIWVTAFLWPCLAGPLIQDTFADLGMQLPSLTTGLFRVSRPVLENRGLSLVFLAAFLALDCWVLWRLSRSSGSRVLRELWSGVVVLVPSALLCAFTLATIVPYLKVMEVQKREGRLARLAPDAPERAAGHNDLGDVLQAKGNLEGAIRCYRTAIDLDPKYPWAHQNLGLALHAKGDLEGAIRCYRTAIDLDPKDAEAHCNLGLALQASGKFAEALTALKRGHEVGRQRKDWRYPSAEWVKACEALLALDAKLPAFLRGEAKPTSRDEQLVLAKLCQVKNRYAAAVRFFTDGFAAEPKLAEHLQLPHRYDAACAAALAGCGMGEDVGRLDDRERARLRQQALTWLRADLVVFEKLAASGKREDRALVRQWLQDWQQGAGFVGVRGDALSKLPELEREGWRKLWEDVEGTRKRAADRK
jgi:serine/threonine protein kinase/tetratricopeptide (TPR) repeat protein